MEGIRIGDIVFLAILYVPCIHMMYVLIYEFLKDINSDKK